MPSIADVVARNVRDLRRDAGLSQDALADRLRRFGLDWTRNSVAYLESGESEPPLSVLLVLSAALGVKPARLLEARGRVSITETATVPAADLPSLLSGRARLPERKTYSWRDLAISAASAGEAERYFARKHGLDPEKVAALAFDLWRRSLTDERDRIAGADAPRMVKAHATRKLQAELLDRAKAEGLL